MLTKTLWAAAVAILFCFATTAADASTAVAPVADLTVVTVESLENGEGADQLWQASFSASPAVTLVAATIAQFADLGSALQACCASCCEGCPDWCRSLCRQLCGVGGCPPPCGPCGPAPTGSCCSVSCGNG